MQPLDYLTYTRNWGFPAEKLLARESDLLKERQQVPFLINLDNEEYKHLQIEEICLSQANYEWKEMSPLLTKIAYVGGLTMFGSGLFGGAAEKSRVGLVLFSCSLLAGSAAWVGGVIGLGHYSLRTEFKKVVEARLQRLIEKVNVIQFRISALENCPENVEEIKQLNQALTYFHQTCSQLDGSTIRDERLLTSTLRVKFPAT
jgi:hypothetical protein